MGTTLRAELSEKNPYWIEKHRYYELKHFCLQYPIWKKAYAALDGTNTKTMNLAMRVITNNIDDPTSRYAIARTYYANRMNMLERVANQLGILKDDKAEEIMKNHTMKCFDAMEHMGLDPFGKHSKD